MPPNSTSERSSPKLEDMNSPAPLDIDPFRGEIHLTTRDKILLLFGTIFILPFRALAVILSLVLAWIVAKIGMMGLTPEEIESRPRHGWRRKLMTWYSFFGRLVFYSAGFHITVKGRQASRAEAPILVGAPHSSFLEALIIIMSEASPVSRHENRNAFLISACQLFYQTIFVDRRKPDSRKETIRRISERARSPGDWLQIFLCPEGTNTNRRVLIEFKCGAFIPGVPVQPVIIRYPGYDRVDAITWTYHQSHSYLFSVWLLLAKPFNRVDVEFLPVYTPDEQEKVSAELYAKNVQRVMAAEMGVPATDITYTKYYEEYVRSYSEEGGGNLKKTK